MENNQNYGIICFILVNKSILQLQIGLVILLQLP
ncbi:unnamed protein product [Paramecium sonneborni]|uniref:Uncharacterized protein n=1 Tax=Paramecium sonneborni TaxID=65129 RepID=A0A8S1M8X2_9CILI|nr:unnamed protein product [Paramecium sonneborni]